MLNVLIKAYLTAFKKILGKKKKRVDYLSSLSRSFPLFSENKKFLHYFKASETIFLDRLKVASCQKNFVSCQAILPVAKYGKWQPKKKL